MECAALLDKLLKGYQAILGDRLAGFYVHGSIAMGCFTWKTGDVDFIAVVRSALTREEKLRLLALLEALRPECPPKGVEMSVVLEKYCRDFVYETPCELHFSEYWRPAYLQDPLALCGEEERRDPDLAAHFTILRQAGIALYGPPPFKMFGAVPAEHYWDSIRLDIAGAREDISENFVYVTLNLCRVMAWRREGLVLSKRQGGEWGLSHLPEAYRPIIRRALEGYAGAETLPPDPEAARRFASEMLNEMGVSSCTD